MENIGDLLRYLSAPRHNTVWSWGSVRDSDGAVFLLVWSDEIKIEEDLRYTQILDASGHGHGYQERIRHIDLINKGATSYLIYCTAKDPKASPRDIGSFNKQSLFRGNNIHIDGGVTWIQNGERIPIKDAKPKKKPCQ